MNPTVNRQNSESGEAADAPLPPRAAPLGASAPEAPHNLDACGIEAEVLSNLTLKLAYTVPRFTSEWAARHLCLPLPIVAELLDQLRADRMVEVLGEAGPFSFTFSITGQGREVAVRLYEISGYVGPAPVSLSSYRETLESQFSQLPSPTNQRVAEVLDDLVLPTNVVEVAGLAITSRRSLFLNGPPGNGKTTIGYLLHNAEEGHL